MCVLIGSRQEAKGKSFSPKLLLDNAMANFICSLLFDKRFDYSDSEFQQLQGDFDKIFEYNALTILVSNYLNLIYFNNLALEGFVLNCVSWHYPFSRLITSGF